MDSNLKRAILTSVPLLMGFIFACGPARPLLSSTSNESSSSSIPSPEAKKNSPDQNNHSSFLPSEVEKNQNPLNQQTPLPIQMDEPARAIGIRIVPASKSESDRLGYWVPDINSHFKVPSFFQNEPMISKNRLLFNWIMPIQTSISERENPKYEYFYVWPKASLGSNITSVQATHRVFRENNQWEVSPSFVRVQSYNQYYYIHITDFLKREFKFKGNGEADLPVRRSFVLEINLEEGITQNIEIHFRTRYLSS